MIGEKELKKQVVLEMKVEEVLTKEVVGRMIVAKGQREQRPLGMMKEVPKKQVSKGMIEEKVEKQVLSGMKVEVVLKTRVVMGITVEEVQKKRAV